MERPRPGRLPAGRAAAGHRRRRRVQRLPHPGLEGRAGRARAETGLAITVCHFPPGTSKWNKIEHRLFSHITMNWRGRPLTGHQVIVESIAATTTRHRADACTPNSTPAATRPGQKISERPDGRPAADPPPLARRLELHPAPRAPGTAAAARRAPARAAWAHPALTGLDPAAWDQLITTLHARLGDPPRARRPQPLNLAEQALITVLSLRFRPHAATLAQLFAVPASAIRDSPAPYLAAARPGRLPHRASRSPAQNPRRPDRLRPRPRPRTHHDTPKLIIRGPIGRETHR